MRAKEVQRLIELAAALMEEAPYDYEFGQCMFCSVVVPEGAGILYSKTPTRDAPHNPGCAWGDLENALKGLIR